MMADQGKMLLITTFRDEPEYPDHELQRECHINGLFDLLSLYDREEEEEEEEDELPYDEIEVPYDEVVYDPENEVFYEIDDFNKESLTKKEFRKLENTRLEEDIEDTCTICLSKCKKGKRIVILPECKHVFHRKCLKKWVCKKSAECPNCRVEIKKK